MREFLKPKLSKELGTGRVFNERRRNEAKEKQYVRIGFSNRTAVAVQNVEVKLRTIETPTNGDKHDTLAILAPKDGRPPPITINPGDTEYFNIAMSEGWMPAGHEVTGLRPGPFVYGGNEPPLGPGPHRFKISFSGEHAPTKLWFLKVWIEPGKGICVEEWDDEKEKANKPAEAKPASAIRG